MSDALPVVATVEQLERIMRAVRMIEGIRGDGVTVHPDGINIAVPPQRPVATAGSDDNPLIPVTLVTDGGSAGTGSTGGYLQCDFTYTVTDLDSNELGTEVTPWLAERPAYGAMVPATRGLWDAQNELLYAWEQPELGPCP